MLSTNNWPQFLLPRCISSVTLLAPLLILSIPALAEDDVVEFLNGSKLNGTVVDIKPAEKQFDLESKIGQQTIRKTYQFSDVHAVTLKGKRHVLTPMPAGAADSGSAPTTNLPVKRSEAEVKKLIAAAAAPPDWLKSTVGNYPAQLDRSWPLKADGPWNNQKNVGQFFWDVVNPNPARWRAGIKLVHEIMATHEKQPALLDRDRRTLGRMYFELMQDYARAAYWLEQSSASARDDLGIKLAECYYRLGSRDMAVQYLTQPILPPSAIKLLAELGEMDNALRLARVYEGGNQEGMAMTLAADALRIAGRNDEAIEFYEKVIASDKHRNEEYRKRFASRAQESIESIRLADRAVPAKVADGSYQESSTGYNGPLSVEVVVSAGKMTSLKVVSHQEKQFYSALDDTPQQILREQSVNGIDGFSGATITSAAIVNATAKALAKGAR
ncbi:MAG: FMN-binding protein [Planctomycetales bacterium]|nr:FMN-binding protein [Planctomycetales bacterium]